ncbi:MAG: 2TM domain-containing protein [Bacteroidota bacterium]
MDTRDKNREKTERYLRAEKKVGELKSFYIHVLVYICVNSFISVKKIVNNLNNGETFQEAFFDLGTFIVWLAWGIGLAFHAFNVFIDNGMLGKNWEDRKIREYMDDENRQNWY